jgi:flagellar basal body-associated protein FliL
MVQSISLDIAPEPAGMGALLSIVLLVIGFLFLLAAALVVVLWFRKRSMRGLEMIRPDALPTAPQAQPNNPNQP